LLLGYVMSDSFLSWRPSTWAHSGKGVPSGAAKTMPAWLPSSSNGVIAIDGTKVAASASRDANRCYEQIAREVLEEARRIDEAEDELYGEARGDELPERLRTREGRRAALREAMRELAAAREAQGDDEDASDAEPLVAFDLGRGAVGQ
jgi:hypothetical protein